ncbi:hypothetical protein NU08_2582 [Flavobacterium anhuiense]|uniref:Uncharacterized protein n=1 Tax=Flavobacterium anhuiense TaxID=459526 RepID=A0A444VXE3_9FLAO|nr:hypothetical protein NU08_2582 [Flavobacterium anhuiense]
MKRLASVIFDGFKVRNKKRMAIFSGMIFYGWVVKNDYSVI